MIRLAVVPFMRLSFFLALYAKMRAPSANDCFFNWRSALYTRLIFPAVNEKFELEHADFTL